MITTVTYFNNNNDYNIIGETKFTSATQAERQKIELKINYT